MIAVCFGTRPEWIKLKPVCDALTLKEAKFQIIFVGQHSTLVEIEENLPDHKVLVGTTLSGNRLNNIISACLDVNLSKYNMVVVQGDTATAYGIALNAYNSGVPICHVEAGLRSFDTRNPYPEEAYRRSITQFATLHACPTGLDRENVSAERKEQWGYAELPIFTAGNTIVNTMPKKKALVTLHRRENKEEFTAWIKAIEAFSKKASMEVTFIRHPSNPTFILADFTVVDPLPREELINTIRNHDMVITDSGGLQEECYLLDKKCYVCRTVTERPYTKAIIISSPAKLESVIWSNSNALLGHDPAGKIVYFIQHYLKDIDEWGNKIDKKSD